MKTYLVIPVVLFLLAACATTEEIPTLEPPSTVVFTDPGGTSEPTSTPTSEPTLTPVVMERGWKKIGWGLDIRSDFNRDGTLWVISHTVPVRLNFTENSDLSFPIITDDSWFFPHMMSEDLDGTLWAIDETLIYSLPDPLANVGDLSSWQTIEHPQDLKELFAGLGIFSVNTFASATNGDLWFGTYEQGVIYVSGEDVTTSTTKDGLPSDQVTSIEPAIDGSVWIGTKQGIAHFDGESWTSYTSTDGLVSDDVMDLSIKPDGDVWIATSEGLSVFDGANWTTFTAADGLPADPIQAVNAHSEDAVWVYSGNALAQYVDGKWLEEPLEFPDSCEEPDDYGSTPILGPDGTLCLNCGSNDLYCYGPSPAAPPMEKPSNISEVILDPLRVAVTAADIDIVASNRAVHQLAFDDKGYLWARTDYGTVRWDTSSGTYEIREPDIQTFLPNESTRRYVVMQERLPEGDYLLDYAVAPDGTEWFSGMSGVYHLDGANWTQYTVEDGLASEYAGDLAISPDNIVWAGFYGSLSQFDGETWTTYGPDDGVPENFEYITVDAEGNLWAAGEYAGIHRFDGETWEDITNEEWEYFILHLDNTDHVWIETQSAVYRWQDGTLLPYHLVDEKGQMPEGYVIGLNKILVTLDGTVWMGFIVDLRTEGFGGLARFQDDELTWYSIADGLLADNVLDIVASPDGTIWMATPNGISGFDGQTWQALTIEEGPPFSSVEHVTLGPDGVFWFLAENGTLFNYNGQIWQEIPNTDWSPNVSSSYFLYGGHKDITTSPDGNIVVASCGGLFHIEDETWVADEAAMAPNTCIESGCYDNVSAGPDGNVWLVRQNMYDYGFTAVHFDGDNFQQYIADESYPFACGETITGKFPPESEEVYDVAAGPDGSAWIVTETGLTHFDGAQWTLLDPEVISGQHPGSVLTDSDGNLWMGTSSGFAFYDGDNWTYYKIDIPVDEDIYVIPVMFTDDGNLWMSIIDLSADYLDAAYSIGHFDGHSLTLYDFEMGLLPYYLDFAVGPDGDIWLVGDPDQGLIHYKLPIQ